MRIRSVSSRESMRLKVAGLPGCEFRRRLAARIVRMNYSNGPGTETVPELAGEDAALQRKPIRRSFDFARFSLTGE